MWCVYQKSTIIDIMVACITVSVVHTKERGTGDVIATNTLWSDRQAQVGLVTSDGDTDIYI